MTPKPTLILAAFLLAGCNEGVPPDFGKTAEFHDAEARFCSCFKAGESLGTCINGASAFSAARGWVESSAKCVP